MGDERYASTDRLWSAEPNWTPADAVGPMTPGRALQLGAGEGRQHRLGRPGSGSKGLVNLFEVRSE
jgi:hypothetical protein